jgi:hypothetical protein
MSNESAATPRRKKSRCPAALRIATTGAGCERGPILVAFQQRILLKLALDMDADDEIVELRPLDRLLQLRRHHQRGKLPQIEALGHCHGSNG